MQNNYYLCRVIEVMGILTIPTLRPSKSKKTKNHKGKQDEHTDPSYTRISVR